MREETQLRCITDVIQTFEGEEPLSIHLKKYFNRNRQLGSRDRRLIREFVYNFFRIGFAGGENTIEKRIALANELCQAAESPLVLHLIKKVPELNGLVSQFRSSDIFPFTDQLSDSIDKEQFVSSFLSQPKLWIRVKNKYTDQLENELQQKKISFEKDDQVKNAWAFENAAPLDKLLSYEKGYFEIQDYSSQRTLELMKLHDDETWWDACAGAGGKSLMIADAKPSVRLFCTDNRESILKNLELRFTKAGIKNYTTELFDLSTLDPRPITRNSKLITHNPIDGIIADVPCTGSGTWSRTPEWITFFKEASIKRFQFLQQKIIGGLVPLLDPGKQLIYITCSVFKDENEKNVEHFLTSLPLKLEQSGYLEGALKGADTLFAARFIKI